MEKSFGFSVHPLNKFYSFLSQTAQIADIKVGFEWSSEAKNAELEKQKQYVVGIETKLRKTRLLNILSGKNIKCTQSLKISMK